jgi:hypothetical protein
VREKKELGLTERLIMAMATEMAEALRNTERASIIFQALALSAGVNVLHVFELAAVD